MAFVGWRTSFTLSWRGGILIFGGAGLVLLSIAARRASEEREKLRTWPLVTAHVDSARVATPQRPRQDVYAPRYWISYQRDGWPVSTVATRAVYTGNYAGVMRELDAARARGTISGIVDPGDPKDVQLDPGYNAHFFFDAILLGALGTVFCGFAILFAVVARKQGLDHPAQAYVAGPSWMAVATGGVMGALFLAGAVIAVWSELGQRRHWTPVTATVDSADVVESTSDDRTTYATRDWVSYAVGGRVYSAPLRMPGSSSSRPRSERMASDARRAGHMRVLVDPGNPYAARTGRPGVPWSTIILVAVFGVFGLLSFALGAVFWRGAHGRRTKRRKPGATPAAGNA